MKIFAYRNLIVLLSVTMFLVIVISLIFNITTQLQSKPLNLKITQSSSFSRSEFNPKIFNKSE